MARVCQCLRPQSCPPPALAAGSHPRHGHQACRAALSAVPPTPPTPPWPRSTARGSLAVAGIRGVESFDGVFELQPEQQESLAELLHSELFCQQVVRDCKLPQGTEVEWSGVLFQPVPWSVTTKKGMPAHIEQQYYDQPQFTFINVPPVFMFKAKIFQPPRLCAIYKRK